jgi:hypothetical protein
MILAGTDEFDRCGTSDLCGSNSELTVVSGSGLGRLLSRGMCRAGFFLGLLAARFQPVGSPRLLRLGAPARIC